NSSAADRFEHLHDFCLVRAPEVRPRLAALEGDPDILGHRIVRILSGRPGESPRLRGVLRISAQDHSRGSHAHRLHVLCNPFSKGEARVESSGVVCPSRWCGFLRFCLQGTRISQLMTGALMPKTIDDLQALLTCR